MAVYPTTWNSLVRDERCVSQGCKTLEFTFNADGSIDEKMGSLKSNEACPWLDKPVIAILLSKLLIPVLIYVKRPKDKDIKQRARFL